MAPKKNDRVLHKTDFPIYTVQSLGDRHFLAGGGGGQSRTGVPNIIEIFELSCNASDGKLQAQSAFRYDTGTSAIMNSATVDDGKRYVLAVGMEENCKVYSLKYKVAKPKPNKTPDTDDNLRKRKGNLTNSESHDSAPNVVTFEVDEIADVKTDYSDDSGVQNVVRFSKDASLMLTGGSDGYLRVWKFPDMKKSFEVKAYDDEVDDVAISPKGNRIVTIGKSGAKVWNTKDGSKFLELVWPKKTEGKYRFRACRYGLVENSDKKVVLYSAHIPLIRKKTSPSYIARWDATDFQCKGVTMLSEEIISCLDVSTDGTFVGVGTIGGSVAVYISFSLQQLYCIKEAHNIFVTGVNFLPSTDSVRALTGTQDFTLLSISADDQIQYHQVKNRTSYSFIWIMVGFIVIIYLLFYALAELGL
ncbi:prolactin regulatory element-binding protein-like [Lineus longissimus]|uniref:prolactin regulatory element-binding protein-like n=1 Tax=Lineus longissimus TaxID=88925 RepID=UPI00315D7B26